MDASLDNWLIRFAFHEWPVKNRGRAENARLQGAWVECPKTLNLNSQVKEPPTGDIKHILLVIPLRCPHQRVGVGVLSGAVGLCWREISVQPEELELFPGRSSELFPLSREQGTPSCVVPRTVRPRGDEKVTAWVITDRPQRDAILG